MESNKLVRVSPEIHERLRRVAFERNERMMDITNELLNKYLTSEEAKHGKTVGSSDRTQSTKV